MFSFTQLLFKWFHVASKPVLLLISQQQRHWRAGGFSAIFNGRPFFTSQIKTHIGKKAIMYSVTKASSSFRLSDALTESGNYKTDAEELLTNSTLVT